MTALVASLPHGSDPAAFVQRHGADAARELVVRADALARAQVQLHLEHADTSTAEGKDHVVAELRDVFVDIPSGAVREELLALVAQQLALDPSLLGAWMATPDEARGAGSACRTNPGESVAKSDGHPSRDLLARCVADPEAAAALPLGRAVEELFPDPIALRAAEHIRVHAANPAADLPRPTANSLRSSRVF